MVTKNLIILDINPVDIIAVGITNQRENIVLWNKITGKPLYNSIGEYFFLLLNKNCLILVYFRMVRHKNKGNSR